MEARHCKRAFLPREVPREVLMRVLSAAAHAPSTRNGQPWRVCVVSGAAREALSHALCTQFEAGAAPSPDISHQPPTLDAAAEQRAADAAAGVLLAKGIAREDAAGRRAQHRDNMRFHGAPVEMIFHLQKGSPHGLFLQTGFFVQNVMLGLVASGLGSCPQSSIAAYPDVIRRQLGLADDRVVVCGLAVGYPDGSAPVNGFFPPRAPLEEYVTWHDQASPEEAARG